MGTVLKDVADAGTPPFGAIVFDLDGTLIDSIPDGTGAVNRALDHHGRRPLTEDEVRSMVGWGAGVLLEKAFAATGEPLREDGVAAAKDLFVGFYKARPAELTVIYPGVRRVLARLREAGIVLGICTNKPRETTLVVLDELDLGSFFAAVSCGDSLPYRKPDGRHVLSTLEMMGAKDMSALFVGDSEMDMAAARDAGIPVIAVSYGYCHCPPANLDADMIIDSFHDLPAALESIQSAPYTKEH